MRSIAAPSMTYRVNMMHRIKSQGLITEAKAVLRDLKHCGMLIVEAMEVRESDDEAQASLSSILGGLVIQSVAIETALNEDVLTLEHKPLVEQAAKTVRDINLHFKREQSIATI